MKLPIGIDDFSELIQGGYKFIDKSLFIKDIIEDDAKVILITRPRRFGKTINMSMLHYYFTDAKIDQNTSLFDNLLISQQAEFAQKHYHQYPTIFLSLKEIKKTSFDDALAKIKSEMSSLYESFRYLLNSDQLYPNQKNKIQAIIDQQADKNNLEESLKDLTEYLYKHSGKKPIILLDEYDTPIHAAYNNSYYTEMVDFLRTFLGKALKGNQNQHKAILTGITRVAQASILSGLNNFINYSVLEEEFGEYFGFTQEEVGGLLNSSNNSAHFSEIKAWYNGYNIGGNTLYNPWSILNCLNYKLDLKPYWLNTADNSIIKKLIYKSKGTIKDGLITLMQGNTVQQYVAENLLFQDLDKNEEAIWALLLYSGYLTVKSQERRGRRLIAELAIPNEEVSYLYDEIVEHWFGNTISLTEYDNFINSLATGDLTTFEAILRSYISISSSYFDFNTNTKEQVFHSLILGLVLGLRDNYIIKSNQESGDGRFDVALIPKDTSQYGIMLELKTTDKESALEQTAKTALKQIENKKYTNVFIEYDVKNILCIGLSFYGKHLKLVSDKIDISSR